MAKKGRPKSTHRKVEFKFTPEEKISFEMAAEIAGIDLKSWVTERLRESAIVEIGDVGMVEFLKLLLEKVPTIINEKAPLSEASNSTIAESQELPPAEPQKTAPNEPEPVDIVQGDLISYLDKDGVLSEGKVVAELEEMQEFVVSNGTGNHIVSVGKVKAKLGESK